MGNKIAIIANGTIEDTDFHKELLEDFDVIICADGGANTAKKMNIKPDYIVGDLDSADASVIDFFKNQNTKIINDNNQDKTDLELALSLAEKLDPNEIVILGAFGDRIDHTLANILCLAHIKPDIKAKIVDNKNIVELVEDSTDISGNEGDVISIVPLTDVLDLSYNGMKWNVKNKDTKVGWFGISNIMLKKKANVSLSKGKVLVIKVRE